MTYFASQLRLGLRYAAWFAAIAAAFGFCYGLISGIVWQPAVFAVLFTGTLASLNFVVAVLCLLVHLGGLPFGKGSRRLVRYFGLSLGFFLVYLSFFGLIKLFNPSIF
ncbi:hypothetical protein [Siphonobacter aquaeclarae]|uniref:Branched-chain amino acid:cation transporter, LIVCS family n=1 Tax=Siphonobacter aquaeclarae TaxID=563176 RepID=A0A1G9R5L2_9BACT|nr:hypothetical protein [Siphonobacter aquaeclarae]SDM18534.1 hypothetical protein SAMN04488090_2752 [Siphonobacter aquaeclarae]